MRNLFLGTAALALSAGAAFAGGHEVKVGIILSFTGPIESLTPQMADAGELAIAEVNESGLLLDGITVTTTRGDSACNAGDGQAVAERMVGEGVVAILGSDCSGATGAILQNVALPNGIALLSASSTSPGLSTVEDNDLFFRTAPSDARQGDVMTEVLLDMDITEVALTYTNNDYGKGLADAFVAAYEAAGGSVTINIPHEDGKADYSAEVANLASAGGQLLVVAGYADQGGAGIIRGSLDTGAFDTFHLPDGMISSSLQDNFGDEIDGSTGQHPSSAGEGIEMFVEYVGDAFDPLSPFVPESYDAAAILLLAMQAAGSTDANEFKGSVMDVANAPGEQIFPGELAKALQILADGGEVDYVGATAVELIGPGEAGGVYREVVVEGGELTTVQFR